MATTDSKKPAAGGLLICFKTTLNTMLAERTGLEPATPGVTGRYSNQLNYHSILRLYCNDSRRYRYNRFEPESDMPTGFDNPLPALLHNRFNQSGTKYIPKFPAQRNFLPQSSENSACNAVAASLTPSHARRRGEFGRLRVG